MLPVPSAPRPPPSVNQPATDFLDPALILQHPGFYYEAAACCSVRRKETFQAALDAETDAQSVSSQQSSRKMVQTMAYPGTDAPASRSLSSLSSQKLAQPAGM